ncbi:MAG: hypothetical protein LBB61_03935 [Treponema sp.]|jgi:hypothetical protein|nr:hypothetical protein [Treponema sp.]
MTRGIFIAGNNSPLLTAIIIEAAKRVDHFAAALIPDGSDRVPAVSSAEMLHWNPGSPIAAKTLTIAAENRLGQINEAILVCAPPASCKERGQLNHSEIEGFVQDQIKGWFLLVKELVAGFRARKAGVLSLVLAHTNTEKDLLAPSGSASFQALAQGLLSLAPSESFQILGFASPETGDDAGFAAFIFKVMEEGNKKNNGRWHKLGKLNFFGR